MDRTLAVLHNWHVVGCGYAMSVHKRAHTCVCVRVCVPSAELPDILTIVDIVAVAETQPTASVPPNQEDSMLRHVDFDVLTIYVHSYGWEEAADRDAATPPASPLGHINVTQIGNCSLTAATPCALSRRVASSQRGGNSATASAILFGFNSPQLAHNLKVAKPRLWSWAY